MNNQQRIIKMVSAGICPHCSKEVMISTKMTAPFVDWCLKREDIVAAKANVRSRVEKSTTVNDEEKKEIYKWLDNEETLFGPDEVDILLSQMLKIKDEPKQDNNTNK